MYGFTKLLKVDSIPSTSIMHFRLKFSNQVLDLIMIVEYFTFLQVKQMETASYDDHKQLLATTLHFGTSSEHFSTVIVHSAVYT